MPTREELVWAYGLMMEARLKFQELCPVWRMGTPGRYASTGEEYTEWVNGGYATAEEAVDRWLADVSASLPADEKFTLYWRTLPEIAWRGPDSMWEDASPGWIIYSRQLISTKTKEMV